MQIKQERKMKTVDPKKQIEIAIRCGHLAKTLLGLSELQHEDLLRMSFAEVIKELSDLESAMPWKEPKWKRLDFRS